MRYLHIHRYENNLLLYHTLCQNECKSSGFITPVAWNIYMNIIWRFQIFSVDKTTIWSPRHAKASLTLMVLNVSLEYNSRVEDQKINWLIFGKSIVLVGWILAKHWTLNLFLTLSYSSKIEVWIWQTLKKHNLNMLEVWLS